MRTSRRLVSLVCIAAAVVAVFWLLRGPRDEAGVPDTSSKVDEVTSGPGPRPSTAGGESPITAAPPADGPGRTGGELETPPGDGPPASITGTVLDDDADLPLPDATLVLRTMHAATLRGAPVPDGPTLQQTRADARGRFQFDLAAIEERLPPGQWMRVVASADGYATRGVRVVAAGADVELRLPPAGELEVRVRDTNGTPARGATVEVHSGDTVVSARAPGDVVRVGALPPGPAWLRVGGRGLGIVRAGPVVVRAGERTTHVVLVPAAAALAGRVVVRGAGTPIAGATVRAARPGTSSAPAETDADGRFAIEEAGGRGERVLVSVDAPGHAPALVPVVLRPPAQGVQTVEIPLDAAAPWEGEVLGPTGRPAAGATVRYTENGVADRAPASTQTDENGRFSLPPPPPPAPGRRVVLVAEKGTATAALALRPGQLPPRPLLLHLDRGATVAARLVDAEGLPAAGAQVRLWPDWSQGRSAHSPAQGRLRLANERGFADLAAGTDASGWFTVSGVPAGRFHLEVRWKGHARFPGDLFAVGTDDVTLGTLTLGTGARITGNVADATGRALPGVRVRLRPRDLDGPRRPRQTHTDSTGTYAFVDLRPGPYVVSAVHDGRLPAAEDVVVDADGLVVDLRLDAQARLAVQVTGVEPGRLARVQLRAADGRPVGGPRTVQIEGDPPGFAVAAPPGRFQVTVTAGDRVGHTREPVEVTERYASTATIALGPPAGLAGRVADRRGAPVAGARLTFVHVHRGTRHDVTAGADGAYRLVPLEPGMWRVNVDGRGGVPATFQVEVAEERVTPRTFTLQEGGAVRVTVVDAESRPQAGAIVLFRDDQRPYPASPPDRTDADGTLVRAHLPPGPLRVDARLEGWRGTAAVEVVEHETTEVTVTIARAPGR